MAISDGGESYDTELEAIKADLLYWQTKCKVIEDKVGNLEAIKIYINAWKVAFEELNKLYEDIKKSNQERYRFYEPIKSMYDQHI